jgi:hypothetical protein
LKGGNDGGEGQESRNREGGDLRQAEAEEKDLSREVIVLLPVAQLISGAASAKEAT